MKNNPITSIPVKDLSLKNASPYEILLWAMDFFNSIQKFYYDKNNVQLQYNPIKNCFFVSRILKEEGEGGGNKGKIKLMTLCDDLLVSEMVAAPEKMAATTPLVDFLLTTTTSQKKGAINPPAAASAFEPLIGEGVLTNFYETQRINLVIRNVFILINGIFTPTLNRLIHLVQYEIMSKFLSKTPPLLKEAQEFVDQILNQQKFQIEPRVLYTISDPTLHKEFIHRYFPAILTESMGIANIRWNQQQQKWHLFEQDGGIKYFPQNFSIADDFFAQPNSLMEYEATPSEINLLRRHKEYFEHNPVYSYSSSSNNVNAITKNTTKYLNMSQILNAIQINSATFKRRRILQHIKYCAINHQKGNGPDFNEFYETVRNQILMPFFKIMSPEAPEEEAAASKNDAAGGAGEEILDFNTRNIITFTINSFRKYFRNMLLAEEVHKLGISKNLLDGGGSLDAVDPYFLIFHSKTHGTGKTSLAKELFVKSFERVLFSKTAIKLPVKYDASVLKPKDLSSSIKLADAGSNLFQFFDDLGQNAVDVNHLKAITTDSDYTFQLKNQNEVLNIPFCFNPIFTSNIGFGEVKKLINDPTGSRRLLGVVFPETISEEIQKKPEKLFSLKNRNYDFLISQINPNWNPKTIFQRASQNGLKKQYFITNFEKVYHHYKIANDPSYAEMKHLEQSHLNELKIFILTQTNYQLEVMSLNTHHPLYTKNKKQIVKKYFLPMAANGQHSAAAVRFPIQSYFTCVLRWCPNAIAMPLSFFVSPNYSQYVFRKYVRKVMNAPILYASPALFAKQFEHDPVLEQFVMESVLKQPEGTPAEEWSFLENKPVNSKIAFCLCVPTKNVKIAGEDGVQRNVKLGNLSFL